jgi:peptidoglycan/LPS O-acetylase OafA/YrhL
MDYGRESLFIITLILLLGVVVSLRKKNTPAGYGNNIFTRITTSQLKGLAVLILVLGHLELTIVDGRLPFPVDEWAVMIFLFISALSLYKTYGLARLDKTFLIKRAKRLMVPTWISLFIFVALDYFILGRSHSAGKTALMFMGIIGPEPPNGPMWFIFYIIFLYLLYYVVSKLPYSLYVKFVIFGAILYMERYLYAYGSIFLKDLKGIYFYFELWGTYAIIYPFSTLIAFNHTRLYEWQSRIFNYSRSIYFFLSILSLVLFIKSVYLFSSVPTPYVLILFLKSIPPVFLIIFLVLMVFLLDHTNYYSRFLCFLGKYSFEIFIVHLPFMVYYDFFLHRVPLSLWFFVYFLFVIAAGIGLAVISKHFVLKLNL